VFATHHVPTHSLSPGPLEDYAVQFDDLFGSLAQRRGFRDYLQGLLLPRERNKTLTTLAGAEPVVGAQHREVQRLQFFLSESTWNPETINARRIAQLQKDPTTQAHAQGVLVIDETGDRKDGTRPLTSVVSTSARSARPITASSQSAACGPTKRSTIPCTSSLIPPLHACP